MNDPLAYVDEIKKIVCDSFFLDPGQVADDTQLEDLGIDSKRRVQLLATLEVHFGITIDLDERDLLTDARSVSRVVANTLGKAQGAPGA
ncbi:acyl carrier protein [Amycolatopsis anabasis]|uniref:acyl carrier protein n=1 Tax=Amycolatopsis anabasis TaxID=1840409 RepID=UPI00131ABB2D|nr:acyl carrier protein [Amycolatopsis anabasis]